jgi:hypothetical protein
MEKRIGIGAILAFVLATNFLYAQRYTRVLDCFGTLVSKDADSTVYSDIKPWIDTAQDSAHFLGIWGGCNPPHTCNPIFIKNPIYEYCDPNPGCTFDWVWPRIYADLVNNKISTIERNKIYDTWAADLNSTFHLQRLFPTFIEDSIPLTVDSSNSYAIGPYPWLTKAEILALSKKCYINKIGLPFYPVANRSVKPLPGIRTHGKAFNGKGQKLDGIKSGVYYLRPRP